MTITNIYLNIIHLLTFYFTLYNMRVKQKPDEVIDYNYVLFLQTWHLFMAYSYIIKLIVKY